MYKLKQTVLMLCFILSGALCYAHGEARTVEKEDGVTVTDGVTVANYNLSAGETQKVLDLRFLADGVYFYTVLCGKHSQTGKLIIVK